MSLCFKLEVLYTLSLIVSGDYDTGSRLKFFYLWLSYSPKRIFMQ